MKRRIHRSQKLRDSANGAPCVMFGPTCSGGGERQDVAWRHANDSRYGKGTGTKGHDLFGFYGCQACENWYAGADLSTSERDEVFLPAWRLSMIYACENGAL